MKRQSIVIVILSGWLVIACGTGKGLKNIDDSFTTSQLIQNHIQASPKFNTLATRVQVSYDDGSKSQSATVHLRMEKDKTIWVSASIVGITIAKLMITPDRVNYYETLSKSYFDGDFSLLSMWLGVSLDFEMAQNILLGNAVFPLDEKLYSKSISGKNYRLTPFQQSDFLKHIFLINPLNYKMTSQQIMQPQEQRVLTVDYASYQEAGNYFFPKSIKINAVELNNQTSITLDFRPIDFNANVSFPFTIPRGYDKIQLR